VLAVAAHDGFVSIEQTHSPRRTEDPKVLALADRVCLQGDDDLERVWPALRPAVVRLSLRDGRTLTTRIDYAAGSPERPLTRHEVEDKFLRLTVGVIGDDRAKKLVDSVWQLERIADIGDLTMLLRPDA
jgi:2-methylcitrate dehydratase PrpD